MEEDKTKKGFTRRNFIIGSAIGAAGLASASYLEGCAPKQQAQPPAQNNTGPAAGTKWSWETPPAPINSADIKNQQSADIVIIGDGLAGLCAALAAKEAGANPVIIEKNDTWAGRGGHIAGFGTKTQAGLGIKPDYRQIVRSWVLWAQGRIKEDLLWTFAHKSGASLDWVTDMAKAKGLQAAIWDGYYKGPDYTEYPVTHFFYQPSAGGTDFRYENGVAVGVGNDVLLSALESTAKERGIQIFYNMPAVQLVKDGSGTVTGLIAGPQGNYTQFSASHGVIICSGDYASNQEMVQRYDPLALMADAQIYFPNKCNTGDGHIMAMHAGGAMQKVEPHAAVIHLEAGASSYGFLHVNALGKRYKNEDVNTQSKSVTKAFEKDNIAWSVYDADGLREVRDQVNGGLAGGLFYGQMFQRWGEGFDLAQEERTLQDHIKAGKVVTADTLEELATKMNLPADAFVETVRRYNELATNKNDVDFGKRAALVLPVQKAPFYAGKLLSTVLTMSGGLRTNSGCQVLDVNDNPVPHLYVAGAAAGDFFANDYPTICPGIGHGRCITFGRMAGIIAAGKSVDEIIPSLKI